MTCSVTAIGYSGDALSKAMGLQKHVGDNGFCGNSFMGHVVEALQNLDLIGGGNSTMNLGITPSNSLTIMAAVPFNPSGLSGHTLA